jgi:hypothetical protein
MLRKIASLSVALIVASGVMVAVPAQAATPVTNGVSCTKSGASTKTSAGTYKCAKNPLVTNSKLTWLKVDCLTAANDVVKAKKTSAVTIAQFMAEIPPIDASIAEQKLLLDTVQKKLADVNTRLPLAQAKATAATKAADKAEFDKAVRLWTSASRAYASQVRQIELAIRRLDAARLLLVNKPKELTSTLAGAEANAKLFCTKGL